MYIYAYKLHIYAYKLHIRKKPFVHVKNRSGVKSMVVNGCYATYAW